MTDSYQAVYDAVRSRISNGDIGRAVSDVARQSFDVGHVIVRAQEQVYIISYEMTRPSVLYRPSVAPDGDKWCALYGPNLMEGVAGFGNTPAEAMADFDKNWLNEVTPVAARKAEEDAA